MTRSVLGAAWIKRFPDLLAFRTDREALGVAAGHPDLAAECDDGSAHHHRLGQLVLGHVVGEALVVALLNLVIGALLGALVDNGLGARTRLLTHVGQSRQRGASQSSYSLERRESRADDRKTMSNMPRERSEQMEQGVREERRRRWIPSAMREQAQQAELTSSRPEVMDW